MRSQLTMPDELVVRQAHLGDETSIRDFGFILWYRSASAGAQRALPQQQRDYLDSTFIKYWAEEYIRFVIEDDGSALVVAEMRAKIVGLAMAIPKDSDAAVATLSRLNVLPTLSVSALSQKLLEQCESYVPRAVTTLETCVPQADPHQVRFFEQQGYHRQQVVMIGNGPPPHAFVKMTKWLRSDLSKYRRN